MPGISCIRPLSLALVAGVAVLLLMLLSSSGALAAPNPSTTGQPNANCETETAMPAGFGTSGFAHAKDVYAGAGHSTISNNPNAVSQYDVACYQLSNK